MIHIMPPDTTIPQYYTLAPRLDLSVRERQELLGALLDTVTLQEESILQALEADISKGPAEGYLAEIDPLRRELRLFIRNLPAWAAHKRVRGDLLHLGSRAFIAPEPYGRTLIFSPWNYPFLLALQPLVAALAAGNSILLSPSPKAPRTASIVQQIVHQSIPPHVAQVLAPSTADTNELLNAHFDCIMYTGGPAFAKTIASHAAQHLTPIILELGGKSPCVVDAGADMALAARRIAWGKFLNAGQTCVAPDYILLQHGLLEPFLGHLERAWSDMKRNFTIHPNGSLRVVNEQAAQRARHLVATSGASPLVQCNTDGKYVEPLVVLNPDLDAPIMQEELFLPILPIVTYETLDEAIRTINERDKPLALYYFGPKRGFRHLLQCTSSGTACRNDVIMQITHPRLPFGGVGLSGMGRYHGRSGFEQFSNMRSVLCAFRHIDPALRYNLRAPWQSLRKKLRWL